MTEYEEVVKNNMKTVHILVGMVAVVVAIVGGVVARNGMPLVVLAGGFVVGLVGAAIYFIPSYIAASRNHSSRVGITVLNAIGGMFVLGWIVAIVWAVTGGKTKDSAENSTPKTQQSGTDSLSEQISKLKELHEQGALSDEEYQLAKSKLLS